MSRHQQGQCHTAAWMLTGILQEFLGFIGDSLCRVALCSLPVVSCYSRDSYPVAQRHRVLKADAGWDRQMAFVLLSEPLKG